MDKIQVQLIIDLQINNQVNCSCLQKADETFFNDPNYSNYVKSTYNTLTDPILYLQEYLKEQQNINERNMLSISRELTV